MAALLDLAKTAADGGRRAVISQAQKAIAAFTKPNSLKWVFSGVARASDGSLLLGFYSPNRKRVMKELMHKGTFAATLQRLGWDTSGVFPPADPDRPSDGKAANSAQAFQDCLQKLEGPSGTWPSLNELRAGRPLHTFFKNWTVYRLPISWTRDDVIVMSQT